MRSKKQGIQAELELIRKEHGGVLQPKDVVEYARNPETALHSKFEWNNNKCGDAYRLWQARELIQVFVTVIGEGKPKMRTFVSLRTDRVVPGGGYRATAEVLSNRRMRLQLLAEALDDAKRWQEKYAALSELAPVFREIEKLRARQKVRVA